MKRYLVPLTTAVLFNLNVPVSAADPGWWATRGVKNASPASNLLPATIGQAKHMAAMALAELQTQLSPADYSALQSEVAAIVRRDMTAMLRTGQNLQTALRTPLALRMNLCDVGLR